MNAHERLERAAALKSDDRYLLIKRLGQGGMGVVWLAEALGPGGAPLRTVVLKTVLPFANNEEEMKRRAALFLREMAVTAALEHPNIVRVTGWGTDLFGDTHFFEMERVEGLSLLDLLVCRGTPLDADKKWGALPAQDIAWIGMQAASGLHYAHNHARTGEDDTEGGVAHRDIDPSNIMIDTKGHVKITDWGIAKALDTAGDASRTGTIAGKAKYMAPEQIRGHGIGAHTDVYGLGITLTVALAAKDVFPTTKSSSWESIAMAVLQGERLTVAELAPHAPHALQALLESMIHRDYKQRPRTAGELIDRFEDIALELGGRTSAIRKAVAGRIQEHYTEGKSTTPVMKAAERPPTKSTRRPISAATLADREEHDRSAAQPATQQLDHPATQQLVGPAPSGSQPVIAPAPSSTRPALLIALGAGSVALILIAGLAGFIFAGSALQPDAPTATTTAAQAGDDGDGSETAPPEPEATVTPPSPAEATNPDASEVTAAGESEPAATTATAATAGAPVESNIGEANPSEPRVTAPPDPPTSTARHRPSPRRPSPVPPPVPQARPFGSRPATPSNPHRSARSGVYGI